MGMQNVRCHRYEVEMRRTASDQRQVSERRLRRRLAKAPDGRLAITHWSTRWRSCCSYSPASLQDMGVYSLWAGRSRKLYLRTVRLSNTYVGCLSCVLRRV